MSWEYQNIESIVKQGKGNLVSGPFGSNISRKYFVEEGVPVIRGNNLPKDFTKFFDDGFVFVTKEKAIELKNCLTLTDDIIFTSAGTVGDVGLIPKQTNFEQYIISNKQIRLRVDTEKIYPLFVYYWLKQNHIKQEIVNLNTGSSIPLLTLGSVKKISISFPKSLSTQKRIASILSTYDDLIENNLKRIKLLEETAQNIYKEWFVNFRFPNYENTPFNEETGLPVGWEMKKLNDIAEVLSSKRVFLSDYVEEGVPFYRGKEITQKSNFESISETLYISEEKFLELKSKTGSPSEGEILITGVGTIGNSYLINEFDNDFYFKDGNLLWIKNISHLISPEYLIRYFKSQNFTDVINSICIGSSQKAITINSLKNIGILIPHKNEIRAFTDVCKKSIKQVNILMEQNQKLKEARDILLPRLMNRTIEV